MKPAPPLLAALVLALPAPAALAQSLFLRQPETELTPEGRPDPQADLRSHSLYYFAPPEPRRYAKHDIVTIIIDESSRQESNQSLETEKEFSTSQRLGAVVDPLQLLQLRLRGGDTSNLPLIDAGLEQEFSGEGDYERSDRFSARITAEVLEVKPNGTIVLQARKRISKDDELQTLVLSGVARREDITEQNTVLSSQLANLDVTLEHEGELRRASKKGLLSRVLETVFNF